MKNDLLSKTNLRTIQYQFEDGLVELAIGLALVMTAAFFFLQGTMANRPLADGLAAMFVLITLTGWYALRSFVRALKERITIPRTGLINQRPGAGARPWLAVIVGGLVVLTGGLFAMANITIPIGMNLLPIFVGTVIALVFALLGLYSALPRFYMLAVASLGWGVALALSSLSNDLATAAYGAGLGLVLLVTGGYSLAQYMRRNPIQTEATDGN